MSKKAIKEVTEPVDEVTTETTETTEETIIEVVDEKKPNFFKRHWKKIAAIGAAVTAIGGIVLLATRKSSADEDEEDTTDYVQALKEYAEDLTASDGHDVIEAVETKS